MRFYPEDFVPGYYPDLAEEDEINMLEEDQQALRAELDEIDRRLKELEASKSQRKPKKAGAD